MTPIGKDITKSNEIACSSTSYTLFVFYTLMFAMSLLCPYLSHFCDICTIDGHITLNPRLICAPRCCIEYVITHELCHLIYRSHNKNFYALLTREMPHWEKWKNKLEILLHT